MWCTYIWLDLWKQCHSIFCGKSTVPYFTLISQLLKAASNPCKRGTKWRKVSIERKINEWREKKLTFLLIFISSQLGRKIFNIIFINPDSYVNYISALYDCFIIAGEYCSHHCQGWHRSKKWTEAVQREGERTNCKQSVILFCGGTPSWIG